MATATAGAVEVHAIYARVVYSMTPAHGPPDVAPGDLADVLSQLDLLVFAAWRVSTVEPTLQVNPTTGLPETPLALPQVSRAIAESHGGGPRRWAYPEWQPTVVRLEMRSPLTVLLGLPPEFVLGGGLLGGVMALLALAERVCLLKPKIRAERQRLRTEQAKHQLEEMSATQRLLDLYEQELQGLSRFEPEQLEILEPEEANAENAA